MRDVFLLSLMGDRPGRRKLITVFALRKERWALVADVLSVV
jgi:hypothetical protein